MMSDRCSGGNCSSGSCSGGSCQSDDDRLPPGMLSRYDLNQDTGLGSLIWAETVDSKIDDAVIKLIGKLRSISNDRIFAMITGPADIKPLYNVLFSYGVDTIYHIRSKDLEDYDPKLYADALSDIATRINPMCIILSATEKGNEVAKLTGSILKKDVELDCSDISIVNDILSVEGSNSGNIPMFKRYGRFTIIATVKASSFDMPERNDDRKGTVISRPFTASRT